MERFYGIVADNEYRVKLELQNKFHEDEIYFEDDKKIIAIQGAILNLDILLKKTSKQTIKDLIEYEYDNGNDTFFKNFRGNFYGIYCDKIKHRAIIFVDHYSNKPIYYNELPRGICFADNVKFLLDIMSSLQKSVELNMAGVYSLLTYAYMYKDNTLFKGVKKLLPGHYVLYDNCRIKVIKYYSVNNECAIDISEKEAIERIDELFLEAVDLQLKKNKKYGYNNYVPLSAGLDSRMTTYAINRLNGENVINFTYSQSQQQDNIIPSRIASDLKNIWIFKNLDNGIDLFDVDESIDLADSLIYYLWPSQLNGFMKLIDTEKMGIVHTGVIGDVVVGSFYKSSDKRLYRIGDGAYSRKLIEKAKKYIDDGEKIDYEIGMLLNRGVNGACMGYSTTFKEYTEAMSPFMYVDFFDYCLKLPVEYRLNHNIYYKWVIEKYPEAAKYSHNGLKIRKSNKWITYKGRRLPVNGVVDRALNILKGKFNIEMGMNPTDFWYKHNHKLREFLNGYFKKNLEVVRNYEELRKDVESLYINGNVIEKALCITLVGTLKKYL